MTVRPLRTRSMPARATAGIAGVTVLFMAVGNTTVAAAVEPVAAFTVDRRVHYACRHDYKRLCPRYRLSSPHLRACMEAKASEISLDCFEALIESGVVDERKGDRQ